jgi:GntR family transcriptional regulator/MocR family aminotransferase
MTPVNESSAAWELLVSLEPGRDPKRHQLARSIADAVREGRLRPQTRLPSSRDLAAQLGVSRGVVTDAYAHLAAQGFLETKPRRAPLVAAGAASSMDDPPEPPPQRVRFDFTPTTPDVALFPRNVWRKALDRALRTAPSTALDYGDPRGSDMLRAALAERLGRTRGVVTTRRRLVIVQGFAQGLDVICALLAAQGKRRLAVEDPALDDAVQTARLIGMEVIAIPVDGEGIDVDALAHARADAALVTPAHQFPTGVVLSSERRRALLDWARTNRSLVIEDDYDAEFRYDGPPLGALQGLAPEHVVYVGTASKALSPALRLGWLALPPAIAAEAADTKWWRDSGSPVIDQIALADVLTRGDFDRSLRRALRVYRARRDRLAAEIGRQLPTARIAGAAAGLHVVAEIAGVNEDAFVAAAAARGVGLRGLRSYAVAPSTRPPNDAALVLGYGRLAEPAIAGAVAVLADAAASARQRTFRSRR